MVTNFKLHIVRLLETHHPVEDIETKEVYTNVQGMRLSQNKHAPKAKCGAGVGKGGTYFGNAPLQGCYHALKHGQN
jgi:hypothetical protein